MALTYSESYPEVASKFTFEIEDLLFSAQSEFQKIDVAQSKFFGKILFIDQMVMLTERDEFVYHENELPTCRCFLTRIPKKYSLSGAAMAAQPVSALSIHRSNRLIWSTSMKWSHRYAFALCRNWQIACFSSRVNCYFEDGVRFVKETDQTYDVVIIDSTDPIAVGEGLFTRDFYQDCFNLLANNGILVNQSESPAWLPEIG